VTTTSDLVTGGGVLLIALIAIAAILWILSGSRGKRSTEEIVFGLLVVLGAIVWPQAATVVLLAFIYLELRRRRLS
jgi:hypothetical protein